MTVRLTIPSSDRCPRSWHRLIAARVLPRARHPRVYRCDNDAARPHFYRETEPGRWEVSLDPAFTYPVRVEDTSRAQIEARGHVLVPLGRIAVGGGR